MASDDSNIEKRGKDRENLSIQADHISDNATTQDFLETVTDPVLSAKMHLLNQVRYL